MKYERLTKKDWHETKLSRVSEYEPSDKVILKQLWELENKIENGTLIELPCKVGDTAYVIEYYEIREYLVTTICIDENNEVFLALERNHNLIHQYPYNVWFTKAEAEKKLKELKK